ncbi:hypothetical protein N7456_006925 [Penicillium angulare]|uniref:Uncharacterized protein n=1 Tax=Penicillium angulare TaxID=116970 RepID=A0A9W9KCF4_9EURO|nr:hypothetical protein N7456_006925 [Penicillium angulare]
MVSLSVNRSNQSSDDSTWETDEAGTPLGLESDSATLSSESSTGNYRLNTTEGSAKIGFGDGRDIDFTRQNYPSFAQRLRQGASDFLMEHPDYADGKDNEGCLWKRATESLPQQNTLRLVGELHVDADMDYVHETNKEHIGRRFYAQREDIEHSESPS